MTASCRPARRYRVRSRTLVDLWRSEPLHWRHVDFLKIDVDIGWHRLGEYLAPLVSARAFSVLVMEVDNKDTPVADDRAVQLLVAHGAIWSTSRCRAVASRRGRNGTSTCRSLARITPYSRQMGLVQYGPRLRARGSPVRKAMASAPYRT